MNLLSSLRDLFRGPISPCSVKVLPPDLDVGIPKGELRFIRCMDMKRASREAEPTAHQLNVQTLAIHRLIQMGWIDALSIQKLGTTSAHKVLTRMRRLGVLYEANDPNGFVEVPNHSGHGRYRRHRWTRKYPPGWDKTERRARKRGGR